MASLNLSSLGLTAAGTYTVTDTTQTISLPSLPTVTYGAESTALH